MSDDRITTREEALDVITDEARRLAADVTMRNRVGMNQYGLWGIWNLREEAVVPEGYDYERVLYYDGRATATYGAESLVELCDEEQPSLISDVVDDLYDGTWRDPLPHPELAVHERLACLDGTRRHATEPSDRERETERIADACAEYLGYERQCVHEFWGLEPDRLFLTRADAERHLAENGYHYHTGAHPFCIGAWRSPDLRRLWDALLLLGAPEPDDGP